MRLTVNHVRRAPQFTNTMLQREIDLRGLSLSLLDESALTLLENQFDVINLTSNTLVSLDYFPTRSAAGSTGGAARSVVMDRVVTLIAHRNQIQRVSVASCVLALPNLRHFLADRNSFRHVEDIIFLRHWKKLEVLSLENNILWEENKENFDQAKIRAFLVFLCPTLKMINWERVTREDRDIVREFTAEFTSLLQKWTKVSPAAPVIADGAKVRKRARANRMLQAVENNTDASTRDADNVTPDANGAERGEDANGLGLRASDSSSDVQEQLSAIEERIMADDVTPEELVMLEQQMNDLTAIIERSKHRHV